MRRFVALLGGLMLYGFAMALMVRAHIGVEPWDAFALGVAARSGLSFGLVTNLIGAAVLLLWLPLRQRPGLGTLLNIVTVGTSAQLGLMVVPATPVIVVRIALFAAGMLLLAVATGLYIGAGFGPGPRDGLMTGLNRRYGVPIWLARTVVEVSVAVAGWALGGDIGVGTVVFAVFIGPLCHRTLPWFLVRLQPAGLDDAREELPGPRLDGVAEDLLRRPGLQDPAAVEEDDLVGDLPGEAHLVGGQDHGHAVPLEPADHREDLADQLRVER